MGELQLIGRYTGGIFLYPGDVLLTEVASKEAAVAISADSWAAYDTELTDALRREGIMRDLLRGLQVHRKEIKLNIEDRVHLTYATDDPVMETIFGEYSDYLKAELLALSIKRTSAQDMTAQVKPFTFGKSQVKVVLLKA